jgi:Methyltransferase domain
MAGRQLESGGRVNRLRRFRSRHERKLTRIRWLAKWRMLRAYGVPVRGQLRYLLWDPEIDNFTYEIANTDELVDFLAGELGEDRERVERVVREPSEDAEFAAAIRRRTRWRPWSKRVPGFGRRLGWYAVTRLRRPGLVVETGIHDGLGSALILRALELNAREGAEGRLISFDPRPETGWLVPEEVRGRWDDRHITSREGFDALADGVDFFVHDSDHTYEVEHFEFDFIRRVASPDAVLLSDNAHATSALRDVAADAGRPYAFWPERPRDHWYPGAGIGLVTLQAGRSSKPK